jgi:hypothetical protein
MITGFAHVISAAIVSGEVVNGGPQFGGVCPAGHAGPRADLRVRVVCCDQIRQRGKWSIALHLHP